MKKLTDRGTDGATITELACGAGDEVLWAALTRAGKAGIDCPLGWPSAFVPFVTDHQAGQVTIPGGLTAQQWRRRLAWPTRWYARKRPDTAQRLQPLPGSGGQILATGTGLNHARQCTAGMPHLVHVDLRDLHDHVTCRVHRAAHEALARCSIRFLIFDDEGFTQ
jgi:hypothetical protein